MHLVSGELFFPALLPGCFHSGQGHPGDTQLIKTNLFSFPESFHRLRSKRLRGLHGRKKAQEIEVRIITGKLRHGREKLRDLSIAHCLNEIIHAECLEQHLTYN